MTCSDKTDSLIHIKIYSIKMSSHYEGSFRKTNEPATKAGHKGHRLVKVGYWWNTGDEAERLVTCSCGKSYYEVDY